MQFGRSGERELADEAADRSEGRLPCQMSCCMETHTREISWLRDGCTFENLKNCFATRVVLLKAWCV